MADRSDLANWRILIMDDNPAIHEDFRKIFVDGSTCDGAAGLSEMETALFGEVEARVIRPQFEPTYATQGKQGVELAQQAVKGGAP